MNVRPRATAGLYSNSGRRGFPYDVNMRSNMAWAFRVALPALLAWAATCSTVSAHTVTTIGAYSLQVGWFSEPPVVGQANRIVFSISPGAEQAFSPDLTGLRYTIVKDGRRVEATPRPIDGRPDWYAIDFTPSEAGAFSLAIEGPLDGSRVSVLVTPETVVSEPMTITPIDAPAPSPINWLAAGAGLLSLGLLMASLFAG